MRHRHALIAAMLLVSGDCLAPVVTSAAERADQPTLNAEEQQFFEKQVRPLLVKHCYQCHSAEAKILKGGLRLELLAVPEAAA